MEWLRNAASEKRLLWMMISIFLGHHSEGEMNKKPAVCEKFFSLSIPAIIRLHNASSATNWWHHWRQFFWAHGWLLTGFWWSVRTKDVFSEYLLKEQPRSMSIKLFCEIRWKWRLFYGFVELKKCNEGPNKNAHQELLKINLRFLNRLGINTNKK